MDAVQVDKENGIYANPEKVHDIKPWRKVFQSAWSAFKRTSPQRTPVLFQAGASTKGRTFAAKNAELIFIGLTYSDMTAKTTVERMRKRCNKNRKKSWRIENLNNGDADSEEERRRSIGEIWRL